MDMPYVLASQQKIAVTSSVAMILVWGRIIGLATFAAVLSAIASILITNYRWGPAFVSFLSTSPLAFISLLIVARTSATPVGFYTYIVQGTVHCAALAVLLAVMVYLYGPMGWSFWACMAVFLAVCLLYTVWFMHNMFNKRYYPGQPSIFATKPSRRSGHGSSSGSSRPT